jgi:Rhs element Vgr protein
MLNLPGAPESRSVHLTTVTVKAAGEALEGAAIVSIDIRREVNRIPKATIVFIDGDAAEQTFALSEEDKLVPGVEVEILGGYSSDETRLFKGIVTRHRIEVHRRGGSHLVVELRDAVFRTALGRRSRNFSDVTDADVIERIVGLHPGLSADVTPSAVTHAQIVQHQASDWDFIVMRAEMAGYAIVCTDGKLTAGPLNKVGRAAASALFGEGLFAAELELDAESQLASVEVGAWDTAGQALATAERDDAVTPGSGDVSGSDLGDVAAAKAAPRHPGARDQAALDQWAKAEMGRARGAAVRGRVRVQGTEALLPGTLIDLGGLGSRFDGLALVSAVRHRLGRGDWTTEAVIGTDPRAHRERFRVDAPGAGGTLPPVRGLQIGIVSALEGDPAGEERIEVRLVTISETDGLVWARQALLDAGSSRGTSFRPEIGDEVVLGFLDDDPRDPVILGALHSSAKPAPVPGTGTNHEKAIVTRAGMRIHWNDEDVEATIDTPGGNSILLSDKEKGIVLKDGNGNSVALGPDGIAIESAKEITIEAATGLKAEAGTNLDMKAGASLKAEGSAGAEVKSGGTTVVKGSMVQIN